ncbi:MAG: class I SAM-dependent methyltransferase [Candidatus Binatus sp.]|uniref:class I SAM-dependent methyltransferase n=1 Tax=Candidatus Binatus sp. TaxID=2811406 RepID=UPI003BB046E4
MSRQTPDYGLDGGRAVRAMFVVGLAAAIGGFPIMRWTSSRHLGLAYTLQIFGFSCLIASSLAFASSRFGKLHARDRIIARLKLRGDESVLDVGCGHGLLLIGAAKLVPRGHAVGIDLWSNWQQADNSREATLRNAALEGVADRVSVHDGDMRKLPFADRSFDAAVAHFAIHNITGGEGRREAIREIVRTLKQGGQVAISDLMAVDLYADELRKSAMTDVEISGLSFWTFPTARTVTARKPAQPL